MDESLIVIYALAVMYMLFPLALILNNPVAPDAKLPDVAMVVVIKGPGGPV